VFQTIVLSRLMYALPAWGPLLNVELVHKINGFLKPSFRYGFTNKLITIQPLLDSATENLFCKMKISNHCLHPLLPPDRTLNQVLRTRGHSFSYPHVVLISIRNPLSSVVFLSVYHSVFLFCVFFFHF